MRNQPGGRAIACGIAVGAVVLVAALDFTGVTAEISDDVPPLCPPEDLACNEQRNAIFEQRRVEGLRLESGFEGRSWLYAIAIVAAVAALVVATLRDAVDDAQRARVFSNLGMAGVAFGIVVSVLLSVEPDDLIDAPARQAYLPSIAMLAAAAIGTVVIRLRSPAEAAAGAAPPAWIATVAPWLAAAAIGLTGLTVVLVFVFAGPQPECGSGDPEEAPGWTDLVGGAAVVTAALAVAVGFAAFLARRWIAALIAFVVNPFALLLMIASTCAFY
jgi:hypothetical protein